MTEAESDVDRAGLIARRTKLLGPAYSLFYDKPVHLVKGEGVWLFDADGNKYLDMYNNVPHVGHCHPHVVKALQKQIETLNTHTRYLHDNVLDYAERLTGKLPAELDVAMFSCTGSEANELALRLARAHTGGTGIIVCTFAYHGNTQAIYEISPEDVPEDEIPGFVLSVPAPDAYRGEYRGDDAGDKYAAHVESAIAEFDKRGVKPAAFVIDTIISSSGVVSPPPGYLRKAAEIIRAAGGLFVADEVQPGFGRTGKDFWGYEVDDFVPDIVTMGKPMGNGHPLAATVARTDIVNNFAAKGSYFNTFGGQPGLLCRGPCRAGCHRERKSAAKCAGCGPAPDRRSDRVGYATRGHWRNSGLRSVLGSRYGEGQGDPGARYRPGLQSGQRTERKGSAYRIHRPV